MSRCRMKNPDKPQARRSAGLVGHVVGGLSGQLRAEIPVHQVTVEWVAGRVQEHGKALKLIPAALPAACARATACIRRCPCRPKGCLPCTAALR